MTKQNGKAKTGPAGFNGFAGVSPDAMKEAFEAATSFGGDFGKVSQANLQAMGEGARAAGKGLGALNKAAFGFAKDSVERNVKTAQALGGVKSVAEFTELQSEFARTSLQTYVAHVSEMTELFTTTLQEAAEPLSAQAGAVAERFQANS